MRSILILLAVAASTFAEEPLKFCSPDGQFAVFMGASQQRHYDTVTNDWVTDSEEKRATVVDVKSRKPVVQFQTPLRLEEDVAIWSADSQRLAVNHRANKSWELWVYLRQGDSFEKVMLPELPEIEVNLKPSKKPDSERHLHLNHDNIVPLRWLKSGELILACEKSITETIGKNTTYTRRYLVTIAFEANREALLKAVTREKQTAVVHD